MARVPEPFGEMLKRLRSQAGMTQEALAAKSKVSVETIRGLENHRRRNPRMSTVQALADQGLQLKEPDRKRFLAAAAGHLEPAAPEPFAEPEPQTPDGREQPAEPDSRAPGGREQPDLDPLLVKAAAWLAKKVRNRWEPEEQHQGVQDPIPLGVRWKAMPLEHMDTWDNIYRSPRGESAEPLDLSGRLDEIADCYRRVPSGRLVVVGRAGAGKTTLTLRIVLDMLKTRAPGDPVPVIFNLESWNRGGTQLRDWLTATLLRDFPDGPASVASLVDEGLILPVLDGFDEVAPELRHEVLDRLNKTAMPLVLTSRQDEYERAVADSDVLTSAAGVQLADLTLDDLNDYLPRTTRRTIDGAPLWSELLARLRDAARGESGDNLAAVLTTPLMVYLARTIYSDNGGRDPSELLDIAKFPDAKAIEAHLLGNLVPTVYRRPGSTPNARTYRLDDVQRWLSYLADHMNRLGTQDLAWWQVGTSMRRRTRMIIVALTVAPVFALVDMTVEQLLLGGGGGYLLHVGVTLGIIAGSAFGLAHGRIAGYRGRTLEPSRIRIRIREPKDLPWRVAAHRFSTGFASGVVTGIGYGVLRGVLYVFVLDAPPLRGILAGFLDAVAFGLVFGLAAGLTLGLVALCEAPLDTESIGSPEDLLRNNRMTTIVQVLLLAPAFAVALAFIGWLIVAPLRALPSIGGINFVWEPNAGLVIGLIGGIGGGIAYAISLTAWGQWLLFARIWLPLTRRLPWTLPDFLKDAYSRGVLRRAGVVYRFRHDRLQEHLATDWSRRN
jgi:transcriptional regulator with XRE-family HTH domain